MALLLAPMFALAAWADAQAQHGWPLWLLTGLSALILVGIRTGRVSWFYAFMAAFFVLGCWFKVMVHHGLQYPYVEPSGNFGDSPQEWLEYYLFANTIGAALLLARGLQLAWGGRGQRPMAPAVQVSASTWALLLAVVAVFYAVNNQAAFFVTGVDAIVRLPFGLNAPLAFMALIGVALVLASLVDRDLRARQRLAWPALLALLLVATIASVSMASRAAVVMQAVPVLIGAFYLQRQFGRHRISLLPVLLFLLALVLVLVVVSIYRVRVFSGISGGDSEMLGFFLLESASLVIDRWVGAEALMVAVAEPTRSTELVQRLLTEDPAIGVDSIYQTLSGGKYTLLQGLTFLTLPGYFGVLALSGSVPFLFMSCFVLMLLGIVFERVVAFLTRGQTLVVVLACAAVANALTQLSFPRLLIPFLLQMLVLCALIGVAQGRRSPAAAARLPSEGPGDIHPSSLIRNPYARRTDPTPDSAAGS